MTASPPTPPTPPTPPNSRPGDVGKPAPRTGGRPKSAIRPPMIDPRLGRAPRPEQRLAAMPPKPTAKPRKVYGGVKLKGKDGPDVSAWSTQRWMRLVELNAPPEQLTEGIQYARLGQARNLDLNAGLIAGRVQGRMPDAYAVAIRLPTFLPEQWEQVLSTMTDQARYAASLLSGELPPNIEDLFAPAGLKLFPTEPSDLAVTCKCDVGVPWCKHVCCLMTLIADRLSTDPFLIFTLRGIPGSELVERLRQRRSASAARLPVGAAPVYLPDVPGLSDSVSAPLEASMSNFWSAGPALEHLQLPIERPEVSHPLLRRLGPSPFDGAKFPLIGLLSTCYEMVGQDALHGGRPCEADEVGE
ncbi:MAG: hypothetical protein H7Y88_08895 [Phycisphaerales bacterium]|nr:hypothetical protein [Phycisphaerales bacterium]